jgi:hypothetical protein
VDRHGEQGHRDALARGEQHVEFPARRQRSHLMRKIAQLVSGVAHCRDDHHDVVAALARHDDPFGDPLDPFGVRDRGTTVLLHHDRHGRAS